MSRGDLRVEVSEGTGDRRLSEVTQDGTLATESGVGTLKSQNCQGHSSLDAPSELNPPQRIPSSLMHY